MSTKNHKNWYAIYTRANAEKKVYDQLCHYGYTAYLPLRTTLRQWSDRKKKVQIPLISSYVFINIEEKKLFDILSIYGAVRVLKYLGKNALVRDEEINQLKLLLHDNPYPHFSNNINLSEGDEVEVIKGSLRGVKAYYLRDKNKHRIYINIKALNSYIGAEVPLNYVKKNIKAA